MSALGDELRRLRRAKRLRQHEVAEALGIGTGSSVSSWEAGDRGVSREHWDTLATVLGVTTAHLEQFGQPYDPSAPRVTRRQRETPPERSINEQSSPANTDLSSRRLQPAGPNATVAVSQADTKENSSPEFSLEAELLHRLGPHGLFAATKLAAILDTHRDEAEQICDDVVDFLRTVTRKRTKPAPKLRRHSEGGR